MQPERRENCILHQEKISVMEKKVDEMHKIICGNGKIGLCAKVDILWGINMFVIVGLTTTIGAFIWELIKK